MRPGSVGGGRGKGPARAPRLIPAAPTGPPRAGCGGAEGGGGAMSLITYLTRVHFADRALEDALPVELRRLGLSRPLVLGDGAAEAGDALERLGDVLEEALPGGGGAALHVARALRPCASGGRDYPRRMAATGSDINAGRIAARAFARALLQKGGLRSGSPSSLQLQDMRTLSALPSALKRFRNEQVNATGSREASNDADMDVGASAIGGEPSACHGSE